MTGHDRGRCRGHQFSKTTDTTDLLVAPSCRLAQTVNARRLGSEGRGASGEGCAARRVAAAHAHALDTTVHELTLTGKKDCMLAEA